MRVRWQFYFTYEDLKFEKTYTYGVQVSKEQAEKFGLPAQEFEATLTIEADEEKHGHVRQRGKINIFLPGGNEQTKDLAYSLAISMAEHINGYYADAVGLATVVLPTGWQERLVPLADEAGNLRAYCLEVRDTCVSKLMAGREKDFDFIKELLERGLVEMETFVARAGLVADMPQSDALLSRLERLEAYLKAARPAHDV